MVEICLLLVDDDPDDAEIFVNYFQRAFDHLTITHVTSLPDDLDGFDGVVIDLFFGTDRYLGAEYAKAVHGKDWRIPTMILTGHYRQIPNMAQLSLAVDWVADKNDVEQAYATMRAFLRSIARLKDARHAAAH